MRSGRYNFKTLQNVRVKSFFLHRHCFIETQNRLSLFLNGDPEALLIIMNTRLAMNEHGDQI